MKLFKAMSKNSLEFLLSKLRDDNLLEAGSTYEQLLKHI